MPRGGASDHSPFNAVGVPGFFWGKTGVAKYSYAWHTQNDKIDQAIPEYLTKNSTVSAIVAYSLADADTLLPRAPAVTDDDEANERPRRRRGDRQAESGESTTQAATTDSKSATTEAAATATVESTSPPKAEPPKSDDK